MTHCIQEPVALSPTGKEVVEARCFNSVKYGGGPSSSRAPSLLDIPPHRGRPVAAQKLVCFFFLAKDFCLPKRVNKGRKPLKIKGFSAFLLGKESGKATCQTEATFAKDFATDFTRFHAVKDL